MIDIAVIPTADGALFSRAAYTEGQGRKIL